MKFLEQMFDTKNIIPLNIYYNTPPYGSSNEHDTLDIIFKDLDTGRKHVKTIIDPVIEIWITKPEYRNYTYIKNFFEMDKCFKVTVKYRSRFFHIAKLLDIPADQAKYSPYIFQADMKIEHFYLMQFILEYGNTKLKKMSCGYLDIESDIIRLSGFPEPGEAPTSCVTFIDEERMQVYTIVVKADNLPHYDTTHPKYAETEAMRESFWKQVDAFENDIPGFIQECKDNFESVYGEFNYNILLVENEIDLYNLLFKIIRASDNDFILIWNSPYDMQNLIERPRVLGYDPSDIITDERFGKRKVEFVEDTNALAHKRKHTCNTYTMPTFYDQMVLYAGVRSARGKIPSLKLTAIAQKEIGDEKLDYTEEGDIKHFMYLNFRKYILYNVKDVFLQYGINRKTKDIDNLYNNIYTNAILPNEIFTSTVFLSNSLRMFALTYSKGYLIGSNKNKLYKNNQIDYTKLLGIAIEDDLFAEADDNDADINMYDEDDFSDGEEDEEEDNSPAALKKKKFQGAHVMDPPHMSSTGFKLFNKEVQFIHDYVIDMDITS